MKHFAIIRLILFISALLITATSTLAQTTSFTYQGKLADSSAPAPTNGQYDMQFRLWDNPSAGQGTPQSPTTTILGVPVSGGVFTVDLNFGQSIFSTGGSLYLEISIRPAGNSGGYTSLAPRKSFTSAPYAIQSLKATNATNADIANDSNQLGGIAANQYVLTEDPRLTDSRNPLAGSSNYIQNGTTTQAASNFNVSGNGTAGGTLSGNVVNATTQFNIASSRVLSIPGTTNLFVGTSTGATNTVGTNNTLVGTGANVASNNLTFATALGSGSVASASNSVTLGRALDTVMIPGSLTIGGTFSANIFNAQTQFNIGGIRTLSSPGTNNLFSGNGAGTANSSGQANSFFGFSAGNDNTTGSFNAFFGSNAGAANTTAINNSFFGQGAGFRNTTASDNTFIGNGSGVNNTTGAGNTFVGSLAGKSTVGGGNNTFLGVNAGSTNFGSSSNTFIGANTANTVLTGSGNTYLGTNTDGAALTSNSTAIGFNAYAGQSNTIVLGSINGVNGATADTDVGIGTSSPESKLHVVGDTSVIGNVGIGTTTPLARLDIKDSSPTPVMIESSSIDGASIQLKNPYFNSANWKIMASGEIATGPLRFYNLDTNREIMRLEPARDGHNVPFVYIWGTAEVNELFRVGQMSGNGSQSVCRNSQGYLATCSSSLRYKKNIGTFSSGLSLLKKLNPITFRWKSDNTADLGFGAEDVAKVEPLLVNYDKDGRVEGVKYDRISAVFVNAVKEQQAQIELLQKQVAELKNALSGHLETVKKSRISRGKKYGKRR